MYLTKKLMHLMILNLKSKEKKMIVKCTNTKGYLYSRKAVLEGDNDIIKCPECTL